jgi:hypothetical protein
LGAWLSAEADVDNDNTIDAGFEACTNPSGSSMPDADVAQIGTAINVLFDSLFASGVSLGPYTSTQWSAFCTALGMAGQNFCGTYSAAAITGGKLEGVRTIIRSQAVGLNTCSTDSVPGGCAAPVCP